MPGACSVALPLLRSVAVAAAEGRDTCGAGPAAHIARGVGRPGVQARSPAATVPARQRQAVGPPAGAPRLPGAGCQRACVTGGAGGRTALAVGPAARPAREVSAAVHPLGLHRLSPGGRRGCERLARAKRGGGRWAAPGVLLGHAGPNQTRWQARRWPLGPSAGQASGLPCGRLSPGPNSILALILAVDAQSCKGESWTEVWVPWARAPRAPGR